MGRKKATREKAAEIAMELYLGYIGYLMLAVLLKDWHRFLADAFLGLGILTAFLFFLYWLKEREVKRREPKQ